MTERRRTDLEHERLAITRLSERLLDAYRDRYTTAHITAVIDRAVHRFDQARIREFVPLLVERDARDALRPHPGDVRPAESADSPGLPESSASPGVPGPESPGAPPPA